MTYDLESLRDELDGLALQVGSNFNVELDHSPESVEKVEEILGRVHDDLRRTGVDDGLNGIAIEFAAYIIKVIERNFGRGEWQRDHPVFGSNSFPYSWRGKDLFPLAWCQKRIFDGPGDNVWAKIPAVRPS